MVKKRKKKSGGFGLVLFIVALLLFSQSGMFPQSITAHVTSTTTYGDTISITFSDYMEKSCPLGVGAWDVYVEPPISAISLPMFDEEFPILSGVLENQMIVKATSWTVPDDERYVGTYDVFGRILCYDGTVASKGDATSAFGYSRYSFTIHPKTPATPDCTNECSIDGLKSEGCPYVVCGNYDDDPCLELSESKYDCVVPAPEPTPVVTPTPEPTPKSACESKWEVAEWGECIDGIRTRQVYDLNSCEIPTGSMPSKEQVCVIEEECIGITGVFFAKHPVVGTCNMYYDSCDIPAGWNIVNSCDKPSWIMENIVSATGIVVALALFALNIYMKKKKR